MYTWGILIVVPAAVHACGCDGHEEIAAFPSVFVEVDRLWKTLASTQLGIFAALKVRAIVMLFVEEVTTLVEATGRTKHHALDFTGRSLPEDLNISALCTHRLVSAGKD